MRTYKVLLRLACAILIAGPSYRAHTKPQDVQFDDLALRGFSVVVPDVEMATAAWTDLLGISAEQIFEPHGVIFRKDYRGDPSSVGPKIALFNLANMNLTLHQPPTGRNYWRTLLDSHGTALYRIYFSVRDIQAATAFFEHKGGTLVLGDPARTPYANVNLWPTYGVALELYALAPTATQIASSGMMRSLVTPPAAPPLPAGTRPFADNPILSIGFIVPNLKQAISDYANLFGLPRSSVTDVPRPAGTPIKSAALRLPNGVQLEMNEPREGPNIWSAHLARHGRSIFSIGFKVASVRDAKAYLLQKGGKLITAAEDEHYASFNFPELGAVIEIKD